MKNKGIKFLEDFSNYSTFKPISNKSFSRVSTSVNESKDIRKEIVIKSLYCLLSLPEQRQHFLGLSDQLYSLRHPSLIPHDRFSSTDDKTCYHPCFIYPYYKNGCLESFVRKADLSRTQIMIILIGVIEGVRYLHENKIPHMALVPSNILLDDKMHPVMTSFGLSKFTRSVKFYVDRIEANYFPPMLTFAEDEEFPADIYMFGMLCYFLFEKKVPFFEYGNNKCRILEDSIRGVHPVLSEDIPKDVRKLIVRCYDRTPSNRPTAVEVCELIRKIELGGVDEKKIKEYEDFLDE